MNRDDIIAKVREITLNQLGIEGDDVQLQSRFEDDLGADSLDCVELVMAFEEEFGLDIPDEDSEKIKTVGAAVDYLEANA